MHIPEELRRLVTERAASRCEYCGLSQMGQEATFHIDHVFPVRLGGETHADNLALACVSCSLRKGARTTVADPLSGEDVVIFNPRRESWNLHFRWNKHEVVGISPVGRATIAALMMNRPIALAIRGEEEIRGRHPPIGHV